MTTYAHDPTASTIVATWPTGDGAVAHRVVRVPKGLAAELARRTAGTLTQLSTLLWRGYSDQEVDEIAPFRLVEAVRYPNRPCGDLIEIVEDDRAETAHLLGRIVDRAPGKAFRDAIVAEVRAELDAIMAADDGDLTGRARQAVVHVRPDPDETHLAAAHAALHDDPLGPQELLTSIEPNSAAVAALCWLRTSAVHVATVVGHSVADVVALAEAIGHEDLRIVRQVLDPAHGMSDAEVVRDVLQEAVLANRGYFVLCPEKHEPFDPDPSPDGAPQHQHRAVATLLEPSEPGSCLVQGLIRGLHGCFRVYVDAVTTRERSGTDPRLTGPERAATLRARYFSEIREVVRTGS